MRNVIVMGAGQSGANLVAATIASSGCHVGTEIVEPTGKDDSPTFECRVINDINEQIMSRAVPPRLDPQPPSSIPVRKQYWLAPVPEHVTMWCEEKIMDQIAEAVLHVPYCYYDPRFCYTLDVWRPLLDNAVFVCVFQHPAATAARIVQEVKSAPYLRDLEIDFDQALEVWRSMYNYILHEHVLEGDWMFIEYEQMLDAKNVVELSRFVEASLDPTVPKSLRNHLPEQSVDGRTWNIYQQLRQLAGSA